MSAAKNFLFGFVMAVSFAAGMALVLSAFFEVDTPGNIKETVLLALAATAVILILGSGEIAVAVWSDDGDTPIGVNLMRFLGAVSAIVAAFFVSPLIFDALDDSSDTKCKTVSEISIGPVTFSQEDCKD